MIKINVVVADKYCDRRQEVEERLRKAGMIISKVLPILGAVMGTIEDDDVEKFRAIEGVEKVYISRTVHIRNNG